ncbi:uncharacterized protein [Leuresthes tenuis]|uniref:uncharacterized protein n=1 Tax=Leuresthes tenuis TaxID=355514 RepID=UPI003B514AF8
MKLFLLPGPSEAILHAMQRSRRLLFVISPDFLAEKSFSLLECRLGLYLQHGHQASIVAVVYRSISKLPCVEVAQLRQASFCTVAWRGSRSKPQRSRFWLRLRLALPVRPLALGRRLIDSTSSHSDLAALALQRAQRIQNQNHGDRTNQRNRNRTSASQRSRDRKAPPRGRGSTRRAVTCREAGPQHSRRCSGCAGFMGQVEDGGVGLTVVTEVQLGSCDRTKVRSDPIPETDSTPIPDSAHDANHAPSTDSAHCYNHAPSPDSAPIVGQQEGTENHTQQQLTAEDSMSAGKEEGLVKVALTPPCDDDPQPDL